MPHSFISKRKQLKSHIYQAKKRGFEFASVILQKPPHNTHHALFVLKLHIPIQPRITSFNNIVISHIYIHLPTSLIPFLPSIPPSIPQSIPPSGFFSGILFLAVISIDCSHSSFLNGNRWSRSRFEFQRACKTIIARRGKLSHN